MLKLWDNLKCFVKREPVTVDGAVFRLHVTFTTVALLACSILVTASQFVGNPIECIVDGLPRKPVNTYCWITSTFTMPDAFDRERGVGVAHPGVGTEYRPGGGGGVPKYYTYYQWVCFALFFQAMLCYFPKWLWDIQEGGLIGSLVKGLHFRLGAEQEKEERKRMLVRYMLTHVRQHTWYVTKYWMCEFMCLANIVLQIYWMNKFFAGEFIKYGFQVIGMSDEHQDNRVDPMVYIFPRVTKCTFHKFGPSGTIQKHDSLCVLPLNIINEKTYIVIWFWYLLLLIALVLMVGYRISMVYNTNLRRKLLQFRNYMFVTDDVARSVTNNVSVGDWWVLYMIGKNMDPIIYGEVMREIARKVDI